MPAYLQLRLKIVSTFAGQRVQYFCHSYHMLQESNIALYQNKCGILWFVLLCASVLAKSSCPFQFNWKWTRSILLVKVASPKRGPVHYAILFCSYLALQCRSINSWGIKSLMLKCILNQFQLRVFFLHRHTCKHTEFHHICICVGHKSNFNPVYIYSCISLFFLTHPICHIHLNIIICFFYTIQSVHTSFNAIISTSIHITYSCYSIFISSWDGRPSGGVKQDEIWPCCMRKHT